MTSTTTFETACSLLVDNKFGDAATMFAQLMNEFGDHAALRHNLALALECQSDFVGAGAEYVANIKAHPEYMASYLGMANCCLYAREVDEAAHLAKVARDLAPGDPRPWILLSEILFLLHRERDAIEAHHRAVSCIDACGATPSSSHVMIHADFGPESSIFYTFLERSLLSRDSLPLPPASTLVTGAEKLRAARKSEEPMVVFMAHVGTAADIARRLRVIPRDRVFLVTIDNLAHAILKRFEPDASFHSVPAQPHEYPALLLHIGHWLLEACGVPVLLPVVERLVDVGSLDAAAAALKAHDVVLLDMNLAAYPSKKSIAVVDYRRIPPLLGKGVHASDDTFLKIFPASEVPRASV